MPFILMVGLPCSGKTTRANEIKTFLEKECSTDVHVISENDVLRSRNIDKNKFYLDSQKEKEIRNVLKSEALRILGQDNVVILDAGNYIKGYRYELYCATKNNKTTQLTVECVVDKDKTWNWNEGRPDGERYTQESFEALHLRYEAPDSRNRWDSPLIVLQDSDDLNKDAIKGALFDRKPPPPNQSTQSTPLSSSEYLYELDKTTRDIVNSILAAQKSSSPEGTLTLPDYPDCVFNDLPANLTSIQLAKLRRQFLNYSKLHPPASQSADPSKMAGLFVQFLNSSLSGAS
ncbi:Hypothetical protein NTJ_09982 [Nesidiocoris tenuis]|uniref:Protein KTI12 homolog n=1 Tax=Nesidiocoris tenuis TaxID=355587 RepID=A0ABN7AYC1_9HEMI|nr:Hypothetical protein NTJ_09982 [Nesidiocoris tenuis]